MKKQVYNPYLPLNEYIPDGEPHVFGDRIYIYGSHDEAGGRLYCTGHYTTWSAPVDDLSDWRCEGIIYKRDQDPSNADDSMQLWAPDVTCASDGRYYLYYCFNFYPQIGVAVSDSPAGPFAFYGHVHYLDSTDLHEYFPFDPAILTDDDGRVYLYYGFAPAHIHPDYPIPSPGAIVVELEPDMVTVKTAPKLLIPGAAYAGGSGFEGHAFYEASSMRKINGKYYFVYSSQLSHELCYAVSDFPDRGFAYGGTVVSNGDVGLGGNQVPVNMTGNNHGGIVKCKDDYYIFYHRQTHATESSRQGCAERIIVKPDGSIPQVEITSCGLNGGPLAGKGVYSAAIACHLTSKEDSGIIVYGQDRKDMLPYIYEEKADYGREAVHYIANIKDGTVFGFKYFRFDHLEQISLSMRGNADGTIRIYSENPCGTLETCDVGMTQVSLEMDKSVSWEIVSIKLDKPLDGVLPLYISYEGNGFVQIKEVIF